MLGLVEQQVPVGCAAVAGAASVIQRPAGQNSTSLASSAGFQERGSWSENLLFPTGHVDAHTQNEAGDRRSQGTFPKSDFCHTYSDAYTQSSRHYSFDKSIHLPQRGRFACPCHHTQLTGNGGTENDKHSAAEKKEEVMMLCNQ